MIFMTSIVNRRRVVNRLQWCNLIWLALHTVQGLLGRPYRNCEWRLLSCSWSASGHQPRRRPDVSRAGPFEETTRVYSYRRKRSPGMRCLSPECGRNRWCTKQRLGRAPRLVDATLSPHTPGKEKIASHDKVTQNPLSQWTRSVGEVSLLDRKMSLSSD